MTQEEFAAKYLTHLNPQQKKAVQTVDGATLLLAVPGSGKTTVLVTRLGYLVYCKNIAPDSILTMTYTVAATREMKNRFAEMFGEEYVRAMEFRTINGLSAKIIEYYSRNHGRGQPFQLVTDGSEISRLVGRIYQTTTEQFPAPSTVKDICTAITYIKNMMLDKEAIKSLDFGVPELPEIYEAYCIDLRSRRLMDYDDQMKYALDILEQRPEVLNYFQNRYRYLCVDESQDTSKIQHAIISLLAKKHGNLFMVGDEDQSVYGFRAAYPEALMNFEKEYPGAEVLLIEQNYRSTNEIVAVANDFVAKNRFRHKKTIVATQGSGSPIALIDVVDREAQYKYLFQVAKTCHSNTAVLYRNNDSALPLIDLLDRKKIPYRCRQFDGSFFTNSVVLDLTDIINFAYNPYDSESFMRIYYKFGSPLSKKAVVYACQQSEISGKSILEELSSFSGLSSFAKEGVSDLMTLLPLIKKSNGAKAIQHIKSSGYGYHVDTKKLDAGKIDIMMMLGKQEASPRELLNRLVELQEITKNHNRNSAAPFILSTIHSSKGLEYDEVYLLDILDGILPPKTISGKSAEEEIKEYEEARRLFYVAMTRAKKQLHMFKDQQNESAFIREVKGALPVEQFEGDDLFKSFLKDLCGKTYIHKEKGKGKVMAQSGQRLLVEYESEDFDLMTYSELYEERKVVLLKQDRDVEKLEVKQTRKNKKHKNFPPQDIEVLSKELTKGTTAIHIKFGQGIVQQNDGTMVSIRFKGSSKTKKFALKMAAEQGLIKV